MRSFALNKLLRTSRTQSSEITLACDLLSTLIGVKIISSFVLTLTNAPRNFRLSSRTKLW